MDVTRPRVALLGARDDQIEVLAELHRNEQVELTAVYDPDPHAPGLAVAEIAGVPAGADLEARQRLGHVDYVVLPADRATFQDAIEWCGGLGAQLIDLQDARRRWGGAVAAADSGTHPAGARIEQLDAAGARLASRSELGDWLLDVAMRAVGASGGSLQLLAPDTEELYLLTARGLAEDVLRTARHPIGEPISGLTAGMRSPQVLHGEQHSHQSSQRGTLTSAMSVPLETDAGELVGVLNVSTTVRDRRFDTRDLRQLQTLAPHVARLLVRAHVFESGTQRSDDVRLIDTLQQLEERGAELGRTLHTLCEHVCQRAHAESIALYLSTEDGDWVQVALEPGNGEQRGPARRSAAARALLERRWLHLVEYPSGDAETRDAEAPESDDPIDQAVERALAPTPEDGPTLSCVYAPLLGTSPVGVLAVTFASLARADAFMRHGEPTLRNMALYVETRLRERRSRRQLERSTHLGRALPKLFEAHVRGELEAVLVREAARLVSAERVLFRHVDEERRTYSRPILHGVPRDRVETWRSVDARVTERTLERRTAEATTALGAEGDALDENVEYRTSLSVPVVHEEQLIAVLNVYDKLVHDPLENRTFSDLDRDLLVDLCDAAAVLLAAPLEQPAAAVEPALPQPVPAARVPAGGTSEPPPSTREATAAAAEPPAATPGGDTTLPATGESMPQGTDSLRLREELKREIARAERHQREVGVSLVHIKGLRELDDAPRRRLLERIMSLVREYTRRSDLVGWYGPDRLMIVSPESETSAQELELRLRRLLRDTIDDDDVTALVIRVGTSCYPDDGADATGLLQTAASRLR